MARKKKVYIVYRIIYKHRKTGKRYAYCDLCETAMNEPDSFNAFLRLLKGFEENTTYLVQDQYDFIYRMNSSAIFDKKVKHMIQSVNGKTCIKAVMNGCWIISKIEIYAVNFQRYIGG